MHDTKILLLGGTRFVGRMVVERLIQQDYEPVLFHRSAERNSLFPKLKHLNGDRETDNIKQVLGQDWDVVIDFSCQMPLTLQSLLAELRGRVGRYILISSISALDMSDLSKPIGVDHPLLSCSEAEKRESSMSAYGARKAETERVLGAETDLESVVLRPALIFGKYDFSDRMYYWIDRVRTQSRIMLPSNADENISLTYGADLANAIIAAMRRESVDPVYNAISPPDYSIHSIIAYCEQLLDRRVERVAVPPEFLLAEGVQPWADIPLWLNGARLHVEYGNYIEHLIGQPVLQKHAMRATVAHYAEHDWPEMRYGLSKAREAELLQKYAQSVQALGQADGSRTYSAA